MYGSQGPSQRRAVRRIGILLLIGFAHVLIVGTLLQGQSHRPRSTESVFIVRLVAGAEERIAARPMNKLALNFPDPPRIALPLPDIIVPPSPVASAQPQATTTQDTAGMSGIESQPVAARSGPPEIQNVQYARPIALQYPSLSRRLNETGVVVVRVLIDSQGVPVEAVVQKSSGHPRLDDAAVAAVRRALFRPHRENGVAMPAQALVPIRFELG